METISGNFFDISESDIQSAIINIEVISPDGLSVTFKMQKSQQMKCLMSIYSKRQYVHPSNLIFVYRDQLIKQNDTPEILNMGNNNKIYATLR